MEKIFPDYFNFFKKKKQSKVVKKNSLLNNALKILNINGNDINIESVENKYKKLVKKYHPDKHNGDKKYEEKLKKINKAFEEVKKQLTIQ